MSYSHRHAWEPFQNTISAALAALSNQLRAVRTIDDNTSSSNAMFLDLSSKDEHYLEMRFFGNGTAEDSNILALYAARGDNDDYGLVATITLTTGTMIRQGGTDLYADTITLTSELDEAFEPTLASSADNQMAKLWINTNGYSKFMLIATTLGSTTIRSEVAPVERHELPGV